MDVPILLLHLLNLRIHKFRIKETVQRRPKDVLKSLSLDIRHYNMVSLGYHNIVQAHPRRPPMLSNTIAIVGLSNSLMHPVQPWHLLRLRLPELPDQSVHSVVAPRTSSIGAMHRPCACSLDAWPSSEASSQLHHGTRHFVTDRGLATRSSGGRAMTVMRSGGSAVSMTATHSRMLDWAGSACVMGAS